MRFAIGVLGWCLFWLLLFAAIHTLIQPAGSTLSR